MDENKEIVVVKSHYELSSEEGVMFLTKKQQLEKDRKEAKSKKDNYRKKLLSRKLSQYPEDVRFGIAILTDWDHDEYDYKYLGLTSYEEAVEELLKNRGYEYDRIIAYVKRPVCKIENVIIKWI